LARPAGLGGGPDAAPRAVAAEPSSTSTCAR
jgi:hypothetical protein